MHTWLPEHLGNEFGPDIDRKYLRLMGLRQSEMARFEHTDEARAEAGVTKAVIIALTSRYLDFEIPNDYIAEYVDRDPANTVGFASVDPHDRHAMAKLHYAATTLHLRGLKLSSPYQAFHPHAPEAWPLYHAAADLGLVVMFHQGGTTSPRAVMEYANAALLDKVARAFPDLRIIIAHMGQPWYNETVMLMYKHQHVYADISARCHRPWQLHNMLLAAQDYGVIDKVLFGSDFPALRPAFCVDTLTHLSERTGNRLPPIADDIIDDLIYGRPLGLLGLAT
jgi:predicted TIM-barrel fold metal-dependent hydrolase